MKASTVSLKIFNALGQLVATLVDVHKDAGYYQVQWGATVPSGIYFCRLQARPTDGQPDFSLGGGQAGDFTETKKMILLRQGNKASRYQAADFSSVVTCSKPSGDRSTLDSY